LLELAIRKTAEGSEIEDLSTAVTALEMAEGILRKKGDDGGQLEVQLQLAKACYRAAELEPDQAAKLEWLARGEQSAQKVRERRPDRVEGHYYLGIIKGRRAEQVGLGITGYALVFSIRGHGLDAAEIDATFDHGGPYRLLSGVYAQAPPWPTSIGDVDEALEYARKAVEVDPDWPLNHLILAEALLEDDEIEEARKELQVVLDAPVEGAWAVESKLWLPYAQRMMEGLREE